MTRQNLKQTKSSLNLFLHPRVLKISFSAPYKFGREIPKGTSDQQYGREDVLCTVEVLLLESGGDDASNSGRQWSSLDWLKGGSRCNGNVTARLEKQEELTKRRKPWCSLGSLKCYIFALSMYL